MPIKLVWRTAICA